MGLYLPLEHAVVFNSNTTLSPIIIISGQSSDWCAPWWCVHSGAVQSLDFLDAITFQDFLDGT